MGVEAPCRLVGVDVKYGAIEAWDRRTDKLASECKDEPLVINCPRPIRADAADRANSPSQCP